MFSTEKITTVELDPQFVQSVKLLHSSSKDSADQLRNLIDQVIRQKYGSSKMLSNVLPKRVCTFLYIIYLFSNFRGINQTNLPAPVFNHYLYKIMVFKS